MSWLYSQVLVEEFSEDTSLDGEPSVQLSVICTQRPFWHRDKPTDTSRLSQFGLTYAHLTEDHGEAVLTSYLEAFPVRTSRPQEPEMASQEHGQGYGDRWSESFARWDPNLCSWKTAQCSLLGDWEPYSGSWPRSGTMRNGVCWEHITSVLPTKGTASGFLPTPQARDWKDTGPTQGNRKDINLGTYAARHPAPWATSVGGTLNPEWVAWLMGWPIGWTGLEPLAMDRSQQWLSLHSLPSTTDS